MIKAKFKPKGIIRDTLTKKVIDWGFWLLIILGAITIIISFIGKKPGTLDASKYVFNAVVPLIATWIGAVIAFYYGRDNFESATRQALALTKDTLDDIKVRNIMIHKNTIVAKRCEVGKEQLLNLKEIVDLYTEIDKDRIPIFTLNNNPLYIIHRSTMSDFIRNNTEEETGSTVKDVIDEKIDFYRHETTKGFVTISEDTPLQEAIVKMKKVESCKDIFVTENGNPDGEVVGWLTDSLINRFLTV